MEVEGEEQPPEGAQAQQGAPQQGAQAQQGAPQQGAPQQGAPQQGAPQQEQAPKRRGWLCTLALLYVLLCITLHAKNVAVLYTYPQMWLLQLFIPHHVQALWWHRPCRQEKAVCKSCME